MAISEHQQKIENLFEVLEKSKEEPWLMCVPLPRVLQIMYQTTTFSEKSPAVCATAINFHGIPNELAEILRDSNSLVVQRLSGKEDSIPNKLLTSIFKNNIPLFEKLHLNIFKEFGQEYSNNLFQTENKSKEFAQDFLQHKCLESHSIARDTNGNIYLFATIASNTELFRISLAIQYAFLKRCHFSIISIKVIKHFVQEIGKYTNQWKELFPIEFIQLLSLIDNPPCVKCNRLLSTREELQELSDQVSLCIKNFVNRDDELRIILCVHCDWLIHCLSLSIVRSLFVML